MNSSKLPIHSELSRNYLSIPILFCGFVNFFAFCAYYPSEKEASFPFLKFSIFIACCALFFLFIGLLIYYTRTKIRIDDNSICVLNMFGRVKLEYPLSDIVNLQWGNKSVNNRMKYGGSVGTQNKNCEIAFKDGNEFTFGGVDYKNYYEMKKYLFDYCIEKQIIHIRPIEERRRSRRK
jgi:hypothetical protein